MFKMFKNLFLPLGIAALIAAVLALSSDRRGFEELAVRAAIAQETSALGAKCPLSVEYSDTADLELLGICLKYGLAAYDVAQRYPATAAKVFAVYGEDETFQKVLDRYGHPVIPVVAFFVENRLGEFEFRRALSNAWGQIWPGHKPKSALAAVSPEQSGLIAIHSLDRRGNEMLAEFEIVDGKAKRKPVTRFFLGLKELLFENVGDVETILVRGERLPSWKEAGLATLDLTIVAGAVGAVAKVARLGVGVGTAEAVEKSSIRSVAQGATQKGTIRLVVASAYDAIRAVGQASVLVAPAAFIYLAIKEPQLIASAGGWVAEQFGYNRLVGIFVVYLIGVFLVLQSLRPLLWLGRSVGRSASHLVRYHTTEQSREQESGI
jgi:hypothetical protein